MSRDEPNIRERRFPVDQNFDGWRLDQFLASRIDRVSRSKAGDIARYGDVTIDPPRKVKAGTRLRDGDLVILREHLPPETTQYDEISLLYRDDDLLIVDKPAGMLVHEAATVRLNTIQMWLEVEGYVGAEPVHRIDRETSGVLVCAARAELVPPLRELFATDHPDKIYRALVVDPERRWEPGVRETLTAPLGLQDTPVRVRMGPGDLEATTHVEVLGRAGAKGEFADLKVTIETGRQHQIRVHLALEGTPIAGDKLYTHDDAFFMAICDAPEDPELLARLPFARHALHAWRLRIPHPVTGEVMGFEAPVPGMWMASHP